MAKKSFRICYDAKCMLTFALLSTVIFLLNAFAFKGKAVPFLFTCPAHGVFDFKNPLNYLRLFTHILGSSLWQSFSVDMLVILLLGPLLEDRYGLPILTLMTLVSAVVTGVLTACVSPISTTGSACVVFMLILLVLITELSKKNIPLNWVLVFVIYMAFRMHYAYRFSETFSAEGTSAFAVFWQKNVPTLISFAGGLVGSLFAFLVAPKKRKESKKTSESASTWGSSSANNSYGASSSYSSPQPWKTPYDKPNPVDGTTAETQAAAKKKKLYSDEDETVIGTIEL